MLPWLSFKWENIRGVSHKLWFLARFLKRVKTLDSDLPLWCKFDRKTTHGFTAHAMHTHFHHVNSTSKSRIEFFIQRQSEEEIINNITVASRMVLYMGPHNHVSAPVKTQLPKPQATNKREDRKPATWVRWDKVDYGDLQGENWL